MKINIDGVDRQLLLRLLAVYLHEEEASGRAPIQNCSGLPSAHKLFERLQPQGLPIDSDVADYVESPENGQQFEHVAGYADAPDSWFVLHPAIPVNSNSDQYDFKGDYPNYVRETCWPLKITVEEAIRTPIPWRVNPGMLGKGETINTI